MEWREIVCLATLVATAIAAATAADAGVGAGGSLCGANKCSCEAATIKCRCSGDFKDLVVQSDMVGDVTALTKLEVSHCRTLLLKQSALRTAHKLETLFVENVGNATFEMGVFEELKSLLVRNVSSLHLTKSAFQGVKGLNNIVIMDTYIPLLPQWSLYDIKELQELLMTNVTIDAIEKEAISIEMKQSGSKAEINKNKIRQIEARGIQVGNAVNILVANTEILHADPSSVRLASRQSMILKGNTFQPNVNVSSFIVLYNNSIEFSNNTLLNVDILNIFELEEMAEHSPTHTMDRLVSTHSGNKVRCRCLDRATNATDVFLQNMCVRGCHESTVGAFLQSCRTNKTASDIDRLRDICKGNLMPTSLSPREHDNHSGTTAKSNGQHLSTTVPSATRKPKNGAGKNSVHFLPFLVVYLFHVLH